MGLKWTNAPGIYLCPLIVVHAEDPKPDALEDAAFMVQLHGVVTGQVLEISFWEVDGKFNAQGKDQRFGSVKGKVVPVPELRCAGLQCESWSEVSAEKRAAPPGAMSPRSAKVLIDCLAAEIGPSQSKLLTVPLDWYDRYGNDGIEIQARIDTPGFEARSNVCLVGTAGAQVDVGVGATYEWYEGNDIHLYNDGCTDGPGSPGAFADIIQAIKDAKEFVFIVDWSFQPYFRADRMAPGDKGTIGRILIEKALATPDLLIAIHSWDHTAPVGLGAPDEQNDNGGIRLDKLAGGQRPSNLLWRISSRTDSGWTHHQKFVVLDCKGPDGKRDIKAFFGGLDLTKGRYDWPAHPILDEDSAARSDFLRSFKVIDIRTAQAEYGGDYEYPVTVATYDDWYNAELKDDRSLVRQPWHDIHGRIQGPTAWDIMKEFVARWRLDPSSWPFKAKGDKNGAAIAKVVDKLKRLLNRQKLPDMVQQYENPRDPARFPWAAQVYRSMIKDHVASNEPLTVDQREVLSWKLPESYEKSIQLAYLRAIGRAERFVYIETQYLISSGEHWNGKLKGVKNGIAEALVDRILYHKSRARPFHVYIICPLFPEGPPAGMAGAAIRLYEWKTMDYMARAIGDDWEKYISFFFLARSLGRKGNKSGVATVKDGKDREELVDENRRYMIYVHSKLMIVDDRYVILGSANLNERSLAGDRDSEICVGMWPARPKSEKMCMALLQKFRTDLFTEHLGALPPGVNTPETPAFCTFVQSIARSNYIKFRLGAPTVGHLMMPTFEVRKATEYAVVQGRGGPHKIATNELAGNDDQKRLRVKPIGAPDGDDYLPDAPDRGADWLWWSTGHWVLVGGSTVE